MNEEVQKIIKASFCPKEKWVSDSSVQNCFKCDKKFHPLYRRKHHCRYCGQIFCDMYQSDYEDARTSFSTGRKWVRRRRRSGCAMLATRSAGNT